MMTLPSEPSTCTTPVLYIGNEVNDESASQWESELMDYALGASSNQRVTMVINSSGGWHTATCKLTDAMKECQQMGLKIHAHILNAESSGADIALQANTRSAGSGAKLNLHVSASSWTTEDLWLYSSGIITEEELEMREHRQAESSAKWFSRRVESLRELVGNIAATLQDQARESLIETCWFAPSIEEWEHAGAIDCLVPNVGFSLVTHAYLPRSIPQLRALIGGFQLPDSIQEEPIFLLDGFLQRDKEILESLDGVLKQRPAWIRMVISCHELYVFELLQILKRLSEYRQMGGRIYMKVYEASGLAAYLVLMADEVEMARTCRYQVKHLAGLIEDSLLHADFQAGKNPYEFVRSIWWNCRDFLGQPLQNRNFFDLIGKPPTAEQCLKRGLCTRVIG